MAGFRYKSLKSWKIDDIDLTQRFSLSIFTDFRYKTVKVTWLLPIFIDSQLRVELIPANKTTFLSPEPALPLSSGRMGNGRAGRTQSRNHKIPVPVQLRVREVVYPQSGWILRIKSKFGFLTFTVCAVFWERIWKKCLWPAVFWTKMVHNRCRAFMKFQLNLCWWRLDFEPLVTYIISCLSSIYIRRLFLNPYLSCFSSFM